MADDLLSAKQRESMNKLMTDAVREFVELAPISPMFKQVHKVGRELDRVASTFLEMSTAGQLQSTSDELNQLQNLGTRLSSELSKLARQDENYWMLVSGANVFSKQDSTRALELLRDQRKRLLALKEACSGLTTLVNVVIAAANADLKGFASFFTTLKLADVYVWQETRSSFENCQELIAIALVKLEHALNVTADMTKDIDKAIVLFNNSDQREAARTMRSGAFGSK